MGSNNVHDSRSVSSVWDDVAARVSSGNGCVLRWGSRLHASVDAIYLHPRQRSCWRPLNTLKEALDARHFAPLQLVRQVHKQVFLLFCRSRCLPVPPKIDLTIPSRQWMADRKKKIRMNGAFTTKVSVGRFQVHSRFVM